MDVFAGQAGHEELGAVSLLDARTKPVRDLEPSLVIDFGGRVAPQDGLCLHFTPQKSTGIVGTRRIVVNGKMNVLSELRQSFALMAKG